VRIQAKYQLRTSQHNSNPDIQRISKLSYRRVRIFYSYQDSSNFATKTKFGNDIQFKFATGKY